MTQSLPDVPLVRPLTPEFSIPRAFANLATLPGCLWFDSTSRGPLESTGCEIGRYSFLTADPVDTLVASIGDGDPWLKLDLWCRRLERLSAGRQCGGDKLPPFQGGIAGLIGYEAAAWLEPVGVAAVDDLPTPAVSLGLYDWTIAVDHQTNQSWIISQGLGPFGDREATHTERFQRACRRADAVETMLTAPPQLPGSTTSEPMCDPEIALQQYPTHRPEVQSNFTSQGFRESVAEVVRSICRGDSFQVNLAQRLLKKADCSSDRLYLQLRNHNPAPFSGFYRGQGFEVLSSSPEGFLKVRDRSVETRPIKGTVRRTGDQLEDDRLATELAGSAKDRAENVMIVDLMRNDLSRVCEDDSIEVRRLCQTERYEFVQHLVSVVCGRLRDGEGVVDLLRACFPGGSVTGAPKIEAMRTIARLEPTRRGPYCGSIGYISCSGDADFNILIRTITAAHGYWQIPVGGGITARSDPGAEEAETWAKAEGMLRAILDQAR